jgi:hypothetical protein
MTNFRSNIVLLEMQSNKAVSLSFQSGSPFWCLLKPLLIISSLTKIYLLNCSFYKGRAKKRLSAALKLWLLVFFYSYIATKVKQELLGQVSRLRKREGQKYVNFYGKSCRTKVILKNI